MASYEKEWSHVKVRRWVVVGGCGGGAVVGLYIMATREWIKINFLLFIFTEHLTIIDTINFLPNRIFDL